MTVSRVRWSDVDAALDQIEKDDKAAIVAAYLAFEGQALESFDGRGARQTVNVSSFCGRYGLYRGTFARWLKTYGNKETA